MIGYSDKENYCGVVNIENVTKALLFGYLNNLEAVAAYFGNDYLHGFTKEKI